MEAASRALQQLEQQQEEQQQQVHGWEQDHAHAHAHASLWQQFYHDYYTNDAMLAIDSAFYLIHMITTTLHRHIFGTPGQRFGFRVAVLFCAGALVLSLFFRPLYKRLRGPMVLATHVTLTVLRAVVFQASTHKQAILYRGPNLVVEEHLQVGPMLISILAVTAVPMRLYEVLGLQQTTTMHAIVSVAFVVLHSAAALPGARLAYSNCGFYVIQEAHDLVAAVVEGLLAAVSGIPAGQQQTCSSCAGLVVYSTCLLFGSVAVPLYLAHLIEQGAFKRWCLRHGVQPGTSLIAPAAAQARLERARSSPSQAAAEQVGSSSTWCPEAASSPGAGSSGAGTYSRSLASSAGDMHHGSAVGLRSRLLGGSGSSSSRPSSSGPGTTSGSTANSNSSDGDARGGAAEAAQHAQQQDPLEGLVDAALQAQAVSLGGPFGALLSMASGYLRWCMHLLVLSAMFFGSWLLSNGFALVMLPRALSPQQLERWCPNRPYPPYLIAGQVYEGL